MVKNTVEVGESAAEDELLSQKVSDLESEAMIISGKSIMKSDEKIHHLLALNMNPELA